MSKESNAQSDSVMRHFRDGRLARMDLSMLPRDPNRVLGTLRKVICASFNYTRKYPRKLDLFIEVLKYAVNFSLAYKHYESELKVKKEQSKSEVE